MMKQKDIHLIKFTKQKIKIIIAILAIIISILFLKKNTTSNTEIAVIKEEKATSSVKIDLPSNGVNVEYVDISTEKPITSPEKISGMIDESYNASNLEKSLSDYTFLETEGEVNGTFKKEQVSVRYKYAKNSNLNVKFIDKQTGNELINSKQIQSYEGKVINIDKEKIKGYVCETNIGSITMEKEDKEVYLLYNRIDTVAVSHIDENTNKKTCDDDNKRVINLKYVDIDTDKVIYNEKIVINKENKIKVKLKEIEGYKLMEHSNNDDDTIIDEIIKSLGSDLESDYDSKDDDIIEEKSNIKSQYEIVMNCDDSDYIIYYKKV